MDSKQFDSLVRALATGMSRRAALRTLASGVAGGALAALRRRGAGAAGDKVLVCHRTGSDTNPVVLIEVSVDAVPAHEAHGDAIAPDFQNDPANCGGCSRSCDDSDPCTDDSCVDGRCVHAPKDCAALTDACHVGVCEAGTGVCVAEARPDDTPCGPGRACCGDACIDITTTADCGGCDIGCDDDDPCTVDTCEAGACVHTPIVCDDGDPCTTDACVDGACVFTPVEGGACGPSRLPPVAVLEIEAPADCIQFRPDEWGCDYSTPRTTWLNPAFVGFLGCEAEPCAFRFRGTSSTDPDNDIVSWSIEVIDPDSHAVIGSASGTWPTPAAELTHAIPNNDSWYITLTVTDSANRSASDTIRLVVTPHD